MPLPCAAPVAHPVTVRPTTPDGGSAAQPAAVVTTTTIAPVAPARRASVRSDIDVNVLCDAVTDPVDHPLAGVLRAAASGAFPPVDGLAELLPPDAAGTCAVVSFTGHAYVLTELPSDALVDLALDGYGAASHPRALLRLAGDGAIGSLDVVLVRPGAGGQPTVTDRADLEHHPRVQRARHHRRDVRVLGDDRGFVTIGRGLVDRIEMSVELLDHAHGNGAGRQLIDAGLCAISPSELVFAQVAPGNAASLRAFLACGFRPIGSEVLIEVSAAGT
jgi:hypothetical protein